MESYSESWSMSTDSSTNHDLPASITTTLIRETNWWVAKGEYVGITSKEALENLNEALQGYHGEGDPLLM
jgi:predicted RNase H-like HicB family nuclease